MKSQNTEARSIHHPNPESTRPRRRRLKWGLVLSIGAALLTCGARAQTTNVYDGVTVELTNDLYVGYTNSYNQLQVINGAALLDTNEQDVYVGYSAGADGNSVLVSSGAEMDYRDLYIGYYGGGNSLTLSGGGVLHCLGDNSYVGISSGSDNNSVLVTGSGTLWTGAVGGFGLRIGDSGNGNSLVISDSAAVVSDAGSVGGEDDGSYGSNNSVVITGPGSVWTTTGEAFIIGLLDFNRGNSLIVTNGGSFMSPGLMIGGVSNYFCVSGSGSVAVLGGGLCSLGYSRGSGGGNTLAISNGGWVSSYQVYIGTGNDGDEASHTSDYNQVVVTGSGSLWTNSYQIHVGDTGSGNSLLISNGGMVITENLVVGAYAGGIPNVTPAYCSNNVLTVSSGSLIATNFSGHGKLAVGAAGAGTNNLILDNGSVTANLLEVYSNSIVTGCGTIQGAVAIDPGGTMLASCGGSLNFIGSVTNNGTMRAVNGSVLSVAGTIANSGVIDVINGAASVLEVYSNSIVTGCGTILGTVVIDPGGTVQASCGGSLNFTGNVTNNGTMRAINGSVLSVSGVLENNGVIDVINGAANFTGGFVNNGTFQTASSVLIGQASVSGQDVLIQIPSVVGHTYGLQYTISLAPASWADTGPTQRGTGGVLTFTDPGVIGTGPDRFYHVVVTAP